MLIALTLALSSPAHAGIYGGNPKLHAQIVRTEDDLITGDATPDFARLVYCAGGYEDFDLSGTVDPVEGFEVAVDPGDWCGVELHWEDSTWLEGDGSGGTYVIRVDTPVHGGPLLSTGPTVIPLFFVVEEGVIYGGNPKLQLWID